MPTRASLYTAFTVAGLLLAAVRSAPAAVAGDRSLQVKLDAVKANYAEPRNHYNLGVEYFNREMLDEAAKAFENALKTSRGDKSAHQEIDLDCHQILGHIALTQGKYGNAAAHFQGGLKIKPDDPVSLFGRGQAYYLDRKFGAAADEFKRYLNLTQGKDGGARRNAPQALTLLGAMALQDKDYDGAADYFRKVLEEYPKHSGDAANNLCLVLLKKGDELKKKGRLDEALKHYDEAVKANPMAAEHLTGALKSSAFAHYELGVRLSGSIEETKRAESLSHFRVAEGNFARAADLNKGDFESPFFQGLSQYYLERFDKMIESYQRTVRINPLHAEARYNLALAYYRKGLFEPAIEEAEVAKRLQPNDPAAVELVARVYDATVEEYLKRGMEAYTLERLREAIGYWRKVLKLSPTNPDAREYLSQAEDRLKERLDDHIRKGESAYAGNDLTAALREWTAALMLDPENLDVRARLAKVSKSKLVALKRAQAEDQLLKHDYKAALASMEEALKLSPKNEASLKLRLRITKAQSGGLTEIVSRINKALAANDLKTARNQLAMARETEADSKEVLSLAIKVNTRIDQWIAQRISEGRVALGSGKKESAKKAFETVLALAPDNVEAANLVKQLTGVESSAAVSALKAKELNKKGINAYLLGRLDDAEKAWQEALVMEPDNTEIKRYLERVRLKLEGMKPGGRKG